MDYGVRVSQPGFDTKIEAQSDLQFTTSFSTLKIYKTGFINLTTDGSGNGKVWVGHGLGYAPAFWVFQRGTAHWATLDATSYPNAFISDVGVRNNWASDYTYNLGIYPYTDNKNIYFVASGAKASTTYELKYYLFVDLAAEYKGSTNIALQNNFGMKVSKDGIDVKTAEEYQLGYSQKYKALQYYPSFVRSASLTLPQTFASSVDTFQESGTYVDFNHNLGYPPFFFAFFSSSAATDSSLKISVPYEEYNGIDTLNYHMGAFCDNNRVRISFYRSSTYAIGTLYDDWAAETVTVYVYIFTEDLNKSYG